MKTTKERIKVMQAFEDGKEIEWAQMGTGAPTWNWEFYDYRIKEQKNELWIVVKKDGDVSFYDCEPLLMTGDEMAFKATECSEDRYDELMRKEMPRMSVVGFISLSEFGIDYKQIKSDLSDGKYFELEILVDNRQKEPESKKEYTIPVTIKSIEKAYQKEPEYRAFENLQEFAPYLKWWFRSKENKSSVTQIIEMSTKTGKVWMFGGMQLWLDMDELFKSYEMSENGINNWQPCGRVK